MKTLSSCLVTFPVESDDLERDYYQNFKRKQKTSTKDWKVESSFFLPKPEWRWKVGVQVVEFWVQLGLLRAKQNAVKFGKF